MFDRILILFELFQQATRIDRSQRHLQNVIVFNKLNVFLARPACSFHKIYNIYRNTERRKFYCILLEVIRIFVLYDRNYLLLEYTIGIDFI